MQKRCTKPAHLTKIVAEETINKLRTRAGVEKMTVANIDENFDPKRGKYYPKKQYNGYLGRPCPLGNTPRTHHRVNG